MRMPFAPLTGPGDVACCEANPSHPFPVVSRRFSGITSLLLSPLSQEATRIAEHMVKEWGMSERVGLRYIEDENGALVRVNPLAAATTETVDTEINRILNVSAY